MCLHSQVYSIVLRLSRVQRVSVCVADAVVVVVVPPEKQKTGSGAIFSWS